MQGQRSLHGTGLVGARAADALIAWSGGAGGSFQASALILASPIPAVAPPGGTGGLRCVATASGAQ